MSHRDSDYELVDKYDLPNNCTIIRLQKQSSILIHPLPPSEFPPPHSVPSNLFA